ncbi:MAG: TonB-dependent receptor [Bacteroidota bacterium]
MQSKFDRELFFHYGRVLLKFTMKMFIFLCCAFALAFSPLDGLGQNTVVNIKEDRILNVKQAFRLINRQTGYTFIYRPDLIKDAPKQNLEKGSIKTSDLLDRFLTPINFTYDFTKQETIIVRRNTETSRDSSSELPLKEKVQLQVSGTVKDKFGTPLPGANVVEKGTDNGTQTDFDGNFSLDLENSDAILEISYIGFTTQEIPVQNRNRIDVILAESQTSLDEVVIIGYGTQRKSDLTGSVSSIKSEDLDKQPIATIDQGLQGLAAGVQLQQTSGAPGGAISLKIRGSNSISASNQPLYVIDGLPILPNQAGSPANPSIAGFGGNSVQVSNPLNTISPSEIESIEILKDASAVALYGSRASNGVVLITTKRGETGESNITLESFYGVQSIANNVEFMDASQHLDYLRAAEAQGAVFAQPLPDSPLNNTDWIEQLVEDSAPTQNYSVSLNGGSEKIKYSSTLNYFRQDGIIRNTGFQRGSVRVNLDLQAKSWLKFGLSLNSSISDNDVQIAGGGGNYRVWNSPYTWGQWLSPLMPIFNEDGNFNQFYEISGDQVMNPLGATASNVVNNVTTNRTFGTLFSELTLAKGLRYRLNLGGDVSSSKRNIFYPTNHPFGAEVINNKGFVSTANLTNWLIENLVYYDLEKDNHRLNLLGGVTVQNENVEQLALGTEDFANDALGFNALQLGQVFDLNSTGTSASEWALLSFLARANYVLKDRYLFTASFRADGSSKFGENNRFGYFPSFALGWRVSEEPFFNSEGFINNLKVRGSWGISGNQEIPVGLQFVTFTDSPPVPLVDDEDSQGIIGVRQNGLGNPDLKWETTTQTNIGLDFGLFNNRITGAFDYYKKITDDLLLLADLPASSFSAFQNIGKVTNEGIELSLTGDIIGGDDFSWSATLNYSQNDNVVNSLGTGEERVFLNLRPLIGSVENAYVLEEGSALGSVYGYVFDGIFQEDTTLPGPSGDGTDDQIWEAGEIRYRDLNGDGIINEDDQRVIADPNPDFVFGFTQNFSYKNFDLSIFFNGEIGRDVLNYNRTFWETGRVAYNRTPNAIDFWTPENPSNFLPKVNFSGQGNELISTRLIEDGSFVRLRNITLGYTLPISNLGLSTRFYVSGQNILTITDYSGIDPEANYTAGSTTIQGLDFGAYPLAKVYTLGVQVNF